MVEIQKIENRLSLPIRFMIGVFLILGLALVAFYLAMDPGIKDFRLMAVLLSFTALASVLLSYISYRLRWIHHSPSVRWTIMGAYALSSALIFLNIWMTAIRMFASTHDLQLATILLLFATGIAMAFGYFFSSALTDRLSELRHAVQAIAAGKLGTRTTLEGRDEIAELSRTFDEMSIRLEHAAQKQQEADTVRRDLIAWASHDLQTPLASIRLTLEALSDGVVEEPATVARYLATAQREVSALSNLIDDLFQLAQLDAGGISLQPGDYSIRDLVSDTLESFAASADLRQVRLSGQIETGVDTIKMDPKNIGRVLNNLVANAVQHTPAGGILLRSGSRPTLMESWSKSSIRGKVSSQKIYRWFLRSFIEVISHVIGRQVAQAWDWRSPVRSSWLMVREFGLKAHPAKSLASLLRFPNLLTGTDLFLKYFLQFPVMLM